MADSSKKELNARIVLAVSEALATLQAAKCFGIDASMAQEWLAHHRGLDNTTNKPELSKYQALVNKLIDEKPGIKVGEIAERLLTELLTLEPVQQYENFENVKPSNSNSPARVKSTNSNVEGDA